jgi:hypothetical protein
MKPEELNEYADICDDAAGTLRCKDCEGECGISISEYGCVTMKLIELAEKLRMEAEK